MAVVANEVRYVVTLDGSKDVALLSNKFWNRGIPRATVNLSPFPHQRPPPPPPSVAAAGPVNNSGGGAGDAPFRATCPRPYGSPETENANAGMSAAILKGESDAVVRLISEGDVQMDYANDHEEGWLHLAAKAHRGDQAVCMTMTMIDDRDAKTFFSSCPPPLLLFQCLPLFRTATSTPEIWTGRTPWGPPSLTNAMPM